MNNSSKFKPQAVNLANTREDDETSMSVLHRSPVNNFFLLNSSSVTQNFPLKFPLPHTAKAPIKSKISMWIFFMPPVQIIYQHLSIV